VISREASSCAARKEAGEPSLTPQFPERHVGCTGFPADSHDTVWLALNTTLKNHRCPECGSGEFCWLPWRRYSAEAAYLSPRAHTLTLPVYTLKFEPHGSLENDHHH
jgi:hypothetical protein